MKKTIGIAILFIFSNLLYSQGCSDAGLCTAGSMQTNNTSKSYKNNITFGTSLGIGEQKTIIITNAIETNIRIHNNFKAQIKLPYLLVSGKLGNTNGIGDLQLALTSTLIKEFTEGEFKYPTNFNLSFTYGLKLATNTSNKGISFQNNDYSLPMSYQTSLGTNDILMGISSKYKKWLFSLGFQAPFSQKNLNNFNSNTYLPDTVNSKSNFNSRELNRNGDIVFRVENNVLNKGKIEIIAGILPIFHIGNDTYVNDSNFRVEIAGSKGLTLNATAKINYKIKKNLMFNISIGMPFIVREKRPDGLTRSFVFSPSINWLF